MRQFYNVLLNTLVANVTTSYLWFALTFWVYLETRSVLATAFIGGSYMLLVAILSLVFGTIVDHNKKKVVMMASTIITFVAYAIAGIMFLLFPEDQLINWKSGVFWLFSGIILIGGVVENMRNIALSTTVTLLVPKDRRDKANGMVGTVQGVAFMVTSVFSGLSIGLLGMGWTLAIAITLTGVALLHLVFVSIPEKSIAHDPELQNKKIDIRGSLNAIHAIPGLFALIIFTTFNNFVGGSYIALMDPYGLTLFSVELWGIVLGITSTGFILGGLAIAKFGLGKNPIRTLLFVNIAIAILGMLFIIREFWLLYAVGIFVFMCLMPAAEAAEQTIIQRVVPFNRQGRVFGFAQSIESAASPITAFMIGPIAEFWIIPYMNGDAGKTQLGWLLGDGEARGIALILFVTGLITLIFVIAAFTTKSYRLLSTYYAKS
ncbi:multidrug transporter [Candidatus Saccharibacteria bacterium RIFCSPHIGHO2_01_FULL_45_15]|nr:MAG: multidrug transporter [Candidatus Saccharibacteria bacterium RIFCSPHIGHO2_01_FULL_45_15]OGL26869.1 MAG: multidrug transporter [Candidatus Saccharibacteria bacterium RIFCSPHIGHO2_02_FULL_46_12]OGL32176.1 MAG: multidrug transporter [Candidatus Saccharibacteria bacterium RIFCSPHIGHO2_12_FULL_44_22]